MIDHFAAANPQRRLHEGKFPQMPRTMAVAKTLRQKTFLMAVIGTAVYRHRRKSLSRVEINPAYRCLRFQQRLFYPASSSLPSGKM